MALKEYIWLTQKISQAALKTAGDKCHNKNKNKNKII